MSATALRLPPGGPPRHPLHVADRIWPETNCYVDLWIELLHALGLDPVAALPFTLATDFEGDQWTFFKFPLEDLRALFGIEVGELSVWLPLKRHVEEQLGRGRPLTVEVDAWYLPDTSGTTYHAAHVKTSVAVNHIDVESRRLGYFHNAGYFELADDDFDGVFRLGRHATASALPPYVELVKLDTLDPPAPGRLTARALELTRNHLARRPQTNPVTRYRRRFERDVAWLTARAPERFHDYAFATLRQLGASAELAAEHLHWLGARGEAGLEPAALHWQAVAAAAKGMQLKLARAVAGRSVDFAASFDELEREWDAAMAPLVARYGC